MAAEEDILAGGDIIDSEIAHIVSLCCASDGHRSKRLTCRGQKWRNECKIPLVFEPNSKGCTITRMLTGILA